MNEKLRRFEIRYFFENNHRDRFREQRMVLKAFDKFDARKKFIAWLHRHNSVLQYSIHYVSPFNFSENVSLE